MRIPVRCAVFSAAVAALTGAVALAPTAGAASGTASGTTSDCPVFRYRANDQVKIRTVPDRHSSVVGQASPGDFLNSMGDRTPSGWCIYGTVGGERIDECKKTAQNAWRMVNWQGVRRYVWASCVDDLSAR